MSTDSHSKPTAVARRCVVSGRVQGVYYRASAQQRANQAGILGHARNLPDGTVEVFAYGQESVLAEFIAWLWVGPSAAKVVDVKVEIVELQAVALPRNFMTS
jgi:acylphosphatase